MAMHSSNLAERQLTRQVNVSVTVLLAGMLPKTIPLPVNVLTG